MSATLNASASSGSLMRILAASASAATLALASAVAAAPARADLVLDGHGWGHGVGLSQYGAYGYALLDGRDHAWILDHYYPGTTLARSGTGAMRVLLKRARTPRLCGVTRLRAADGRRVRVSERRQYKVSISRGRLRVVDTSNGRTRARLAAPVTATGGPSWCLRGAAENGVRDGAYRGSAQLIPDGRALLVVNRVGLESYLRGVVPSEMPSSWPAEALQAQAVIARSYALRARRPATSPYDVFADVRSQVYGGLAREVPSTTAAVTATRAQVVTAGGTVAQTFFFSTSGGRTATNEEVWGGLPIAYLRSVDDPHDDLSPYHDWTARFTDRTARRKLRSLGVGTFRGMAVTARTPSGRAATVEVRGADSSVEVPASRIQALLELRSTWFDVAKKASPATR
jgi:stage II sporulation protein D